MPIEQLFFVWTCFCGPLTEVSMAFGCVRFGTRCLLLFLVDLFGLLVKLFAFLALAAHRPRKAHRKKGAIPQRTTRIWPKRIQVEGETWKPEQPYKFIEQLLGLLQRLCKKCRFFAGPIRKIPPVTKKFKSKDPLPNATKIQRNLHG